MPEFDHPETERDLVQRVADELGEEYSEWWCRDENMIQRYFSVTNNKRKYGSVIVDCCGQTPDSGVKYFVHYSNIDDPVPEQSTSAAMLRYEIAKAFFPKELGIKPESFTFSLEKDNSDKVWHLDVRFSEDLTRAKIPDIMQKMYKAAFAYEALVRTEMVHNLSADIIGLVRNCTAQFKKRLDEA